MQDVNKKAGKWADAEYNELRYEKCERKNFVFTFRELREMGKQAYIAGYNEAKKAENIPQRTARGKNPTELVGKCDKLEEAKELLLELYDCIPASMADSCRETLQKVALFFRDEE